MKCNHCNLEFQHHEKSITVFCPSCGSPSVTEEVSRMNQLSFFQKLKKIIQSPTRFFSEEYSLNEEISIPLTYAIIIEWFKSLINFFWQIAFGVFVLAAVQQLIDMLGTINPVVTKQFDFTKTENAKLYIGAGLVILNPFLTIVAYPISAAIISLFAKIFRGKNNDFKTVLSIISYSSTYEVFTIIPFIGGLITFFGVYYSRYVGLKEVCGLRGIKGVITAFAPLVFSIILIVLLISLLLAVIF